MNDDRSVDSIFCAAIEIDSNEKRACFLNDACGDDAVLRDRVNKLLAAHENAGHFMAESEDAVETIDPGAVAEHAGTTIGPYKLLQQIGEGGFGAVFMADQLKPMRRKVAIKIIKPGMDTKEVIARFEAERQALAMMNHPNIASVFDGGVTETGRPYFAMELVKGVPITEYCDKNELTMEERLRMFMDVCRAVQHAHQRGIIHRDLKPSNILVTLHDGKPVTKVIDFGVSKAINQPLTERTLFTAYGQMVGTPQYMSPEQAEMSGLDVDTRSDVFSLGILLYELLTGTTPLDAERLRQAGYQEIQRLIREEYPPRPSVRLSSAGEQLTITAKHRSIDPRQLRQMVQGELDWIVMKSLEKERIRRYESVSDLAADIDRFLSHDEVAACPPSMLYRLRKFIRRNRLPVAAVVTILVALVLGIIGTSVGFHAVWKSRESERYALKIMQQAEFQARTEAETNRQLLYVSDMMAALQAWEDHNVDRVVTLLQRHVPAQARRDLRGFEWYHLWHLCSRSQKTPILPHGEVVMAAQFSPDGKTIVTAGNQGSLRLWDVETCELRQSLEAHDGIPWSNITSVAFSPDGRSLASVTLDATLRLWDVENRRTRWTCKEHTDWLNAVAFSPQGDTLATAGRDKTIKIWDAESGKLRTSLHGHTHWVNDLAFSPDGTKLASGSKDRSVRLWDISEGREYVRLDGHTATVGAVQFSPDGSVVASGGVTVRLWDATTGRHVRTMEGHQKSVSSLAFAPDGSTLASGSVDNTAVLWEVSTGKLKDTLAGHASHVTDVSFSIDGNRLASASQDGTVRLWNIESHDRVPNVLQHPDGSVYSVAFSCDGLLAATTGGNRKLWMWEAATGELRWTKTSQVPFAVRFSPDGETVAFANGKDIALLDAETGEEIKVLSGHSLRVYGLAFSPDGKMLASGGDDSSVRIWGVDSGESDVLEGHRGTVMTVAFAPDGRTLATGSTAGNPTVKLWNVSRREEKPLQEAYDRETWSLAFSPDGKTLATGAWDGAITLWDVATCVKQATLKGHSGNVLSVAFSPDGRTLASGGTDSTVRLWDTFTRQERAAFDDTDGWVFSVAFSADGTILASGGHGGMVRLRHAATQEEVDTSGW